MICPVRFGVLAVDCVHTCYIKKCDDLICLA